MKNQTNQNTQQPETSVAQEDKMFTIRNRSLYVPRDHPLRERLTGFFASRSFQIVQAGLDHYGVPYRYDYSTNHLIFGEGDELCTVTCEHVKDASFYDHIVRLYIAPELYAIFLRRVKNIVSDMDSAFAAYKRLHAISINFYDAYDNGIENDANPANLWIYLDDLTTIAFYALADYRVKVNIAGDVGLSFRYAYDRLNNGDFSHIAFGMRLKEILNAFDILRMLYLWHHYSVTGHVETIQHIREDYHQIASRYVCRLNFTAMNDPITLVAVMNYGIIAKKYYATPEALQNMHILLKDIRECKRRNKTKNPEILNILTSEALNSLQALLELNSTDTQQHQTIPKEEPL